MTSLSSGCWPGAGPPPRRHPARQQVYRDETEPLLDHYRDRLVTVDAVGSIEEITDRVADALRAR